MVDALFDTDILIDHIRGIANANKLVEEVEDGKISGYISSLTEAELFAGEDANDEVRAALLDELVSLFKVIDVTSIIGRRAGRIKLKHGVELDDAVIAATAFNVGCVLYTRNLRDFEKVDGLQVWSPY